MHLIDNFYVNLLPPLVSLFPSSVYDRLHSHEICIPRKKAAARFPNILPLIRVDCNKLSNAHQKVPWQMQSMFMTEIYDALKERQGDWD